MFPRLLPRLRNAADRIAEAGGEGADLARMTKALIKDLDEIVDAWSPWLRLLPSLLSRLFPKISGGEIVSQENLDRVAAELAAETSAGTFRDLLAKLLEQLGPVIGPLLLELLLKLLSPTPAPTPLAA
jgi:hypothetical protein